MGGPRPIAYTPFGELTVFVFFGLVAVMGTDWVLTGSVGAITMLASVAIGALAAAALVVNNHRDIAHDRLVGRRTFAVTFGDGASRGLYAALLLGPFALVPLMAGWAGNAGAAAAAAAGAGGLAAAARLPRCPPGTAFNEVLFRTFRLELWFAALLSAGALLGRVFA
jgi:1,4-dihydroxy-2-naphthoate polyprenyltransferase